MPSLSIKFPGYRLIRFQSPEVGKIPSKYFLMNSMARFMYGINDRLGIVRYCDLFIAFEIYVKCIEGHFYSGVFIRPRYCRCHSFLCFTIVVGFGRPSRRSYRVFSNHKGVRHVSRCQRTSSVIIRYIRAILKAIDIK